MNDFNQTKIDYMYMDHCKHDIARDDNCSYSINKAIIIVVHPNVNMKVMNFFFWLPYAL